MKKILVATHGYFADGIKSSIEILCGKVDAIDYINAYVNDRNIDEEIESYFMNVDSEDKVIILTDIIGGSVNQKFIKYNDRSNVFLISGFNLALVLELILTQEQINSDYIEKLVEQSRNQLAYIKDLKPDAEHNKMEDFLAS